jgi:hypothetical protein
MLAEELRRKEVEEVRVHQHAKLIELRDRLEVENVE